MSHRTKLIDRFYIGSAPKSSLGFDAVVLCAKEYQPASAIFRPAQVLRVPLDDTEAPFTKEELRALDTAAEDIAGLWSRGDKVLVTCWVGRNRSAFMSALALSKITGVPRPVVAEYVRATRVDPFGVHALQNEYFWSLLAR